MNRTSLTMKLKLAALFLAVALTLPQIATAQYLLDTGTPTNFTSPLSISSNPSVAVEFSLKAGQSLKQISLYLTPGTQNYLDQYLTLNLFNVNLTTATSPSALTSFQLEYTGSGWNSATTNYVAPTTGNYWITLQTSSSGYTLDAPGEATQPTGTVPAIEFAQKGSRTYSANSAVSFGVRVGVAPEPGTWGLILGGLGVLVWRLRHRRV